MKSLMDLFLCLIEDSKWCNAHAALDKLTVKRRVRDEGVSFLTITLASYLRDFENALEYGSFSYSTHFFGYKRRKGSVLPRFLSGLLANIFDNSGRLLDDPDIDSIFFVRAICGACKKILLPCTPERERKAIDAYIKCDNDVKVDGFHDGCGLFNDFNHVSDVIWSSTLQGVDSDIRDYRHVPKHGPGATAEGIKANDKFRIRNWHARLEAYFPLDLFAIPNWGYAEDLLDVNIVEPGAEPASRLCLVPKTLKTPRTIAIEPVCMQYCQQSLLQLIEPALRHSAILSGCINILDQGPNRRFAVSSSQTGSFATLDLSEASDRVSNVLVRNMLKSVPFLSGAIQACRSTHVELPNGDLLSLNKFASMGSALCFPVEAMVFATICITTGLRELNLRPSVRNIRHVAKFVQVYGDDIIVPTNWAYAVTQSLEAFGLKVNRHKSFSRGKFRESCGEDAYDGYRVNPVYIRRMPPTDRSDTEAIASHVDLRNQLYTAGLWKACKHVEQTLEKYCTFPHVLDTCSGLGYTSFTGKYSVQRWNPSLYRPEVRTLVLTHDRRKSVIDGPFALLKFFLERKRVPLIEGSFEFGGRPLSATLKKRWISPF